MDGDDNTKYFHASVNVDRGRKQIDKLIDYNGKNHRSKASKGEITSNYFANLFKSSNPPSFQGFFHDFEPRVTEDMNRVLCSVVTKEEVKEAIY